MVALLGPVLVLSGFGLYMVTNTLLGRFRRTPREFLAISLLGVIAAVFLATRVHRSIRQRAAQPARTAPA